MSQLDLSQVFDDDKSYGVFVYTAVYIFRDGVNPYCYTLSSNDYSSLPDVYRGLTKSSTYITGAKNRRFYRERTPLDDPPGIGFKAKNLKGIYVSNKDYHVSHVDVDVKLIQLIRTSSDPYYGLYYYKPLILRRNVVNDSYHQLRLDWLFPETSHFLEKDAKRKAILNLYGSLQRRRDINLGVLLAELKESIGLLGKTMYTIASVITALKKGRVTDAISALSDHLGPVSTRKRYLNRGRLNRNRKKEGKAPLSSTEYASNMWLELQFGWLPLLSDIFDLINVVNGSLNSEGDGVLSFSGYGESSYTDGISELSDISSYSQSLTDKIQVNFEGHISIRYASTATFRVSNNPLDILTQLGLTNPLTVAWEVVPFSFVIDWFLPIGNWIDSMTATAGLELIQYSESRKLEVAGIFSGTYESQERQVLRDDDGNITHSPFLINHSYDINQQYKVKEFDRFVIRDEEIPPMPLPSFTFEELFEPWKAITAIALFKSK